MKHQVELRLSLPEYDEAAVAAGNRSTILDMYEKSVSRCYQREGCTATPYTKLLFEAHYLIKTTSEVFGGNTQETIPARPVLRKMISKGT
ncbi:hypothetical protein RUM43_008572 [Polyplax serrata]|uniref:Uncharacterized protein n=1 Tax=Polyplax serrata TaxID=468196 RepID=A0AAN8RTV2_POLSC